MHAYRYLGRTLLADFRIEELPKAGSPGSPSTAALQVSKCQSAPPRPTTWLKQEECRSDGRFRVGRLDNAYLLVFENLASFVISPPQGYVGVYEMRGISAPTLHHLLLDQALPRLLGQSGELVIHASAARDESGVSAFMGSSGQGKSTLAAAFASRGIEAFADDVLLLQLDARGQPACFGAYPGLRLLDDSRTKLLPAARSRKYADLTPKQRISTEPGNSDLSALVQVLQLNNPTGNAAPDIEIKKMSGSEAVMALIKRCFLLDSGDMLNNQRIWQMAANLVNANLPVHELGYPRQFSKLEDLVSAVRNNAKRQQQQALIPSC